MSLECYDFSGQSSSMVYEFISRGPKGEIKKVVEFLFDNANGKTFVHLAFGDWDERTKRLDDYVVTDNKDTRKVLETVAAIVLKFIDKFPDMFLHVRGSTPSRTRLYQIGISKNWNEIEERLHVFGYLNEEWQPFKKNVNYEAFFIRKK